MNSTASPSRTRTMGDQPDHQYQHPPLQVSFDSIPRGSDDVSALPTPPIQQQESILTALAQSVAQDDEDGGEDTEEDVETPGHQRTKRTTSVIPSSSSKTIQDKGNGWALLTYHRSSATSPSSSSSSSSAAAAATAATAADRSLSRHKVNTQSASASTSDTASEMLAISASTSPKHPLHHQQPRPVHASSPILSGSPTNNRPSTPTTIATSVGNAAPVDCDAPSGKLKDHADAHSDSARTSTLAASDARARASIHAGTGPAPAKELPAEGSGLRGTDENPMEIHHPHTDAQTRDHRSSSTSSQSLSTQRTQPSASSPPLSLGANGTQSLDDIVASSTTPLNPPPARKLCIRHQRMADEGTVGKLQRSIESLPLTDQTAVNSVWSIFSSSSHARRALILQGILSMCCFSQLSLLSSELALAIRIDPFSLFPREVSLKVLSHLDAMSLGRAAQVSRSWRALADDDLLWRNMCEQHIERKCDKCGWGLPLLSEKRRRLRGPPPAAGTPESRHLTYAKTGGATSLEGVNALPAAPAPANSSSGNLKRTITAAANAAALERHSRAGTTNNSRASSPSPTHSHPTVPDQSATKDECETTPKKRKRSEQLHDGSTTAVAPATRPWKSVYCERLAIERNWRRGRYTVRSLKGHTHGIMCLQFNESLSHPSFPVAITGSYDRTARIWNMDTGEELRVLKGHTRGVRCLQFDEIKVITGSMDRTLKIWNWRTGDLIRTLEGHTEGIVCLNFNDHLLASGSADSNIKIWNFKTSECHTLRGHTDWVNAVTLWTGKGQGSASATADGAENTFLFSASDDGSIRLWDLAKKECLLVFTGHVGQCQGLSLVHMPEDVVETLANGGNTRPNGQNGPSGRSHGRSSASAAAHGHTDSDYFTPSDGGPAHGASAGSDSADASPATSPSTSSTAQACGFNPPSVPGGRTANTGTAPSIPEHFYNAPASGQHRTALHQMYRAQRNKIDPQLLKVQERLEASGLVDPLPIDAEMADLEWGSAKREHSSTGVGGSTTPAEGSHGDEGQNTTNTGSSSHARLRPMLFSCALDNTIKIWDVRTGVCVRTLFGHMAGLWALSTDRLRLATASHDFTLKVWELATGKHLFSICEHRGPVTCVQIGDDKVVSGSDDGSVNVYSFTGEGR